MRDNFFIGDATCFFCSICQMFRFDPIFRLCQMFRFDPIFRLDVEI
ncbi:hypothetical protein ES703_71424 [subsurface metagenome]